MGDSVRIVPDAETDWHDNGRSTSLVVPPSGMARYMKMTTSEETGL
ncbi:MAG: hypothetical protein JOZ41_08910 [Chloroflexi bacterium]|nr:hypothetical protein [Chloroflexota bacterium]